MATNLSPSILQDLVLEARKLSIKRGKKKGCKKSKCSKWKGGRCLCGND
jgi:hypothetical protein